MRLAIAESDALLREGLAALLTARGFEVTAACDNADDFLAAVSADRPDAVIIDVGMPPACSDDGLRAALRARQRHPGLPVLVLSSGIDKIDAFGELLADSTGGIGYLRKERVGEIADFVDTLRRVAGGAMVLDPEVVATLLSRRRAREPLAGLTAREREVLALMADGHNNSAIADRLVVSDAAVHKHIRAIFAKLDLTVEQRGHRRVQAVLAYLNA
ncbi:response regulator [Nocardia sp. CA-107356]|uniref:response regulator n=1 Tax=Nocardia sp. CA-107356 TaxID=3239972 RepID=UPI003D91C35F